MQGINTQFWTGLQATNPAITERMQELEKLVVPYPDKTTVDKAEKLDMWMIGPLPVDREFCTPLKDGIWICGTLDSGGGAEFQIDKIACDPERAIFYVCCRFRWFACNINKSAYTYAKMLDMLLHGAYTNIIPLKMDSSFFEDVSDISRKLGKKSNARNS